MTQKDTFRTYTLQYAVKNDFILRNLSFNHFWRVRSNIDVSIKFHERFSLNSVEQQVNADTGL